MPFCPSPDLDAVTALPGQPVFNPDRPAFWRAFLDWQAGARNDEVDALQALLADHAPHVRPLVAALGDAVAAGDPRLPASLLAVLSSRGLIAPMSASPVCPFKRAA